MITNYIKTAFRNLIKNKTYSFINIIGLSIGLACSIMVLLFLKNELTYDNFHENRTTIYRVGFDLTMTNSKISTAVIVPAVAPSLLEEFPEVESMVRLRVPTDGYFTYQDITYATENVGFADSTFFDLFSFKLISGTPQSVLNDNYSVVLTKSLAKKIFGKEDPIGKVLEWNNTYSVVVKGITEDCPQNSSIQFQALISFSTIYAQGNKYMDWNGGNDYYNFIKLNPESSIKTVIDKLGPFLEKHINYMFKPRGWHMDLVFDRLDDIHLNGIITNDRSSGDWGNIRLITIIGLFVVLIAIFNFMNLSSAQSSKRSIEIGIRKVLGAHRSKISQQFLGEAVVFSLLALVISLILVEIFQPQFSQFIGDYELYTQSNVFFIIGIVLFSILIGILAGLYPAFLMARFKPIGSLKGEALSKSGKPYLRNILVVLQFIISTAITTFTIIMIMQMMLLQKKDRGFDSDKTIVLQMPSDNAINLYPALKTALKQLANVERVSSSSDLIGVHVSQNGYLPEGLTSSKLINFCAIDEDLIDLLKLEIVAGRNFSSEYSQDDSAYIINEALAREMNWEDPIGKKIRRNGFNHIIGVVKDFNFQNVQLEIKPLIFGLAKNYEHNYVQIKLLSEDYQQSIEKIENVWRNVLPDEPFNYQYYKSRLKTNYIEIQNSIKIMGTFAIMVIVIACMGLFGLATFTVEKRQREIGVRKVFGADTVTIAKLVMVDFMKWILIANIISIPIAYYYALIFLEDFAYTINLDFVPFLISLFISIGIALFTIIFQILKLSNINPVSTLKYE